jgi:hypothetical protein
MQKVVLWVAIVALFGCSRPPISSDHVSTNAFYFSTKKGGIYEYSDGIRNVSSLRPHSMNVKQSSQSLFLATTHAMNEFSDGRLVQNYVPGVDMAAAVMSPQGHTVYFVNQSGELYRYNTTDRVSTRINIDPIYPLPRQMVVDDEYGYIYYHDGQCVYQVNLTTNKIQALIDTLLPIASLTYRAATQQLYVSTSTDGRIYGVNIRDKQMYLFYKTMSANGTFLSMNPEKNQLYYSRSNGRDTDINAIHFGTGEVHHVARLWNVNTLTKFSF